MLILATQQALFSRSL